jgi:DNA-binding transcriptional ArsR family regulator
MVNNLAAGLDACFAALANPTRRALLEMLAHGPRQVTDLAAHFPVSLPAISRHLRVLEEAGLLVRRPDGRERHCELVPDRLAQADAWIHHYQRFWTGRLDALGDYLSTTEDP